jgi:hypothetical protein
MGYTNKNQGIKMKKTSKSAQLKTIVILLPLFIFVFTITKISSIPFWFVYLQVAKSIYLSIHPIYVYSALNFFPILSSILLFLFFHYRNLHHISLQTISKFRTKELQKLIVSSLTLCLVIVLMLPFGFLLGVSQVEIYEYVKKNNAVELESLEFTLPVFLNQNIKGSLNRTEYFEIDQEIFNNPLDCQILNWMGITRADIIIYQGWGSCGQTAIVIEQILYDLGYTSWRAKFIERDHAWAEVENDDGKWQIVDPFIGFFVNVEDLGSDSRFQDASGVIVEFRNGTIVDMSEEHGYR